MVFTNVPGNLATVWGSTVFNDAEDEVTKATFLSLHYRATGSGLASQVCY